MTEGALGLLLIAALGVATYATRIGGHLVLSRFEKIDPRVEAALDAVPAAVLTAIVTPAALAGPAEAVAAIVAVLCALRFPILVTITAGVAVVVALRALGL